MKRPTVDICTDRLGIIPRPASWVDPQDTSGWVDAVARAVFSAQVARTLGHVPLSSAEVLKRAAERDTTDFAQMVYGIFTGHTPREET